MTFPSGGPGYPQQGGGQQPPGPPPTGGFPQQQQQHPHQAPSGFAGLPQNLPLLLALVVAVFGLVQYFLGFSDNADVGWATNFLLVAGLLAGLHALPKGPRTLPFAALFSVLGALDALDSLVSLPRTPGIVTVILLLAILQMLVAVGALLIEYGVVKPPASKPASPSYGGQYGQPGGQQQYGQQFGQQQPGHGPGAGEQAPFAQPGQYGSPNPPSTTPPPGQQATTYAPQQGQFFQQPPSDNPGTPPGGFGKSN
jgi:hypothetical protein